MSTTAISKKGREERGKSFAFLCDSSEIHNLYTCATKEKYSTQYHEAVWHATSTLYYSTLLATTRELVERTCVTWIRKLYQLVPVFGLENCHDNHADTWYCSIQYVAPPLRLCVTDVRPKLTNIRLYFMWDSGLATQHLPHQEHLYY